MKRTSYLYCFFLLFACAQNNIHTSTTKNQLGKSLSLNNTLRSNDIVVHFAVDSVQLATIPLTVYAVQDIIEWKLEKEILHFPSTQAKDSITPQFGNGFMRTIHSCYDQHRPLVLSPDAIWLTICQGISIHVNQHFDELKSVLFKENKPDQLIARNDSLENNSNQWANLIEDLSIQTQAFTRENWYEFFVPQFSTTTKEHQTAYQITLLEVYKDAFTYIGESGCGIPSITLKGTTEDWKLMINKLTLLDKLNLTAWKNELIPILNEFISASKGDINLSFWKDIYKYAFEYNGFYTSGWSLKLFPYLNSTTGDAGWDKSTGLTRVYKSYRPNPFLYGNDYRKSTIALNDYPSGISSIDLLWKNYDTEVTKKMLIYAGFFGAKQSNDLSLEPFISWAIVEHDAPAIKPSLSRGLFSETEHDLDYWSPKFAKTLVEPAIYNPEKFSSHEKSIEHLKKRILDSLKINPTTSTISTIGLSLEIEIYSNGEMGTISLNGTAEQKEILEKPILEILQHLPSGWSPAKAEVRQVLILMDSREVLDKIVAVNSKVVITF